MFSANISIRVSEEKELMATFSYSKLVGGPCGPSVSNPANVHCALIGECHKDIQGHLKLTIVKDSSSIGRGKVTVGQSRSVFSSAVILCQICAANRKLLRGGGVLNKVLYAEALFRRLILTSILTKMDLCAAPAFQGNTK